jgi:hypothetical protein
MSSQDSETGLSLLPGSGMDRLSAGGALFQLQKTHALRMRDRALTKIDQSSGQRRRERVPSTYRFLTFPWISFAVASAIRCTVSVGRFRSAASLKRLTETAICTNVCGSRTRTARAKAGRWASYTPGSGCGWRRWGSARFGTWTHRPDMARSGLIGSARSTPIRKRLASSTCAR